MMKWRVLLLTLMSLLAAPSALGQSVAITVDQLGVGNQFRPGDPVTPLRLQLISSLPKATGAWVQWQVPNTDGDIQEIGRSIGALTKDVPVYLWLYAPLPPNTDDNSLWTIRVFEESNGVRGSEIGGARISPQLAGALIIEPPSSGMIAVIGDGRLGLEGYHDGSLVARPIGGHENTRIISGLRPAQLPDRWFGLMGFEAVVWADDNMWPKDLGSDQADALREYIARGGHLIISLPEAGNVWGLGAIGQTQIDDLLPCRTEDRVPRKDEEVALADLLTVISKHRTIATLTRTVKPPVFSMRVFKDLRGSFDVIDNSYEPLVSMPDGRVIVIQRQFGFGRITVIGLDLTVNGMTGLGLPQADAFWDRILGRQMDTPTTQEIMDMDKADKLNTLGIRSTKIHPLGSGQLITRGPHGINLSRRAGAGLLLAFVLFVVYWLVAGPAGFAALKHYGFVRHAWISFAACAVLFTAIAWGAVSMAPKSIEVKHITFLDHVARPADNPRASEPQYQRAVSFFSVYLPNYGSTPVAIESTPDQRDLLTTWTPPGIVTEFFPNVDRYRIDMGRSPASYSMPTRSTSTQMYANWMGGLDPKWGGMLRVDKPIRAVGLREDTLEGSIINELPGTLTNVSIIWVKNNRIVPRRYDSNADGELPWVVPGISGKALNSGVIWRLDANTPFLPGGTLDFSTQKGSPVLSLNIKQRYVTPYVDTENFGNFAGPTNMDDTTQRKFMEALSIFHQLTPPEYIKISQQNTEGSVAFQRQLGRELDLSPWFNRPCLIIIGFLDQSKCPIPLRVDGEPPAIDSGLTVVRWVYPLALDPKIAFDEAFKDESGAAGSQ